MAQTITLSKATALSIGQLDQPVITHYQLGLVIHRMFEKRSYEGAPLRLKKENAERRHFTDVLRSLIDTAVLRPSKDFPEASVYEIFGKSHSAATDIACTVDPFCYVSHLSAMAYHGLTDRIPRTLFLSSPAPKNWKSFAAERMRRDLQSSLDAYLASGFPALARVKFGKISGQRVECHYSVHLGAFRTVKGKALRVATIGRTFLDMLREPNLCGGIDYVLEVYKQSAEKYLGLIVDEIDSHGAPIDKVRAGYVLSERCRLHDSRIDAWRIHVQRGGSRKLDSSADYSPRYSEQWSLSINVLDAEPE